MLKSRPACGSCRRVHARAPRAQNWLTSRARDRAVHPQRNWKDAIDPIDSRVLQRGSELLVGVLGSGQVFGEVCAARVRCCARRTYDAAERTRARVLQVSVLDPNQLSPVTIIAYTNVELYSISKAQLLAQHASFNVDMVNFLNESMMMHNPPRQKIAQYLRNRLRWERNKSKILTNMMPPKARVRKLFLSRGAGLPSCQL